MEQVRIEKMIKEWSPIAVGLVGALGTGLMLSDSKFYDAPLRTETADYNALITFGVGIFNYLQLKLGHLLLG